MVHMVCCDQEFVKEVNFDFIWKGKDKVKRSGLVGDIEDGGLKDGAYYCYCAYVLRISEFLSVMLTNAGIFLRGLKLSRESRS